MYLGALVLNYYIEKHLGQTNIYKRLTPINRVSINKFEWYLYGVIMVILEELLFRGSLIYVEFDPVIICIALLFNSLLFGISHVYFGFNNMIVQFVVGLVLGCMAIFTGNVLYSILLHVAFNTTVAYRQGYGGN